MNVIKDAVHGNIQLNNVELKVVDTPELQRLRGVKQMAVAYLVYPGANHTRFEHSLGTMHITGEICRSLSLGEEETKTLRMAALLHDVGHAAFSHETDGILLRMKRGSHESRGVQAVLKGESGEILEEEGYDVKAVCSEMLGGRGGMIDFDLGSDRMDYLLRDSHYTGVAYGVIDSDRLVHTIKMRGGKAVVEWGGIEAAESLLIARFLMFSSVYYHHTVRIASAMLERAIELALEDGAVSIDDILKRTDAEVGLLLEKSKRSCGLMRKLRERKLYKRAYEVEFYKLSREGKKIFRDYWKMRDVEEEIKERSGVEEVMLECRQGYDEKFSESKVIIVRDGKEYRLENLSEIVGAIRRTEEMRRRALVICPKESKKRVEAACRKLFEEFIVKGSSQQA
ncbi:MAG: HD domain-containing protein [Candidatus Micrarchaeia archaeon]